jgi:hypothetical protein
MSREYARRLVSTWTDKDFKALDLAHQGLYDALSASPDLSRCGVMPWMPDRIAQCAEGLTGTKVTKMVGLLVDRDFLRLDKAFGELMVRSYVRHDNVLGVPNISKSMARSYRQILSPYIRDSFIRELARLMVASPDLPGWQPISKVNPELHAEVLQHPLCEHLRDVNREQ